MHRTEAVGHSNNQFVNGTTIVESAFLNSVQEEIAGFIENSGGVLKTRQTDTHGQLWPLVQRIIAPFDIVVRNQTDFDNIIERTGANTYKIIDSVTAVFIKELTDGYTLLLSGGDTWGKIQTNACVNLTFESGAYIAITNVESYIEVNTDSCKLTNVEIRGDLTSGSNEQSFFLNAENVYFKNCKIKNIKSDYTSFTGFRGSATALHNVTSKYSNCSVSDCHSNGIAALVGVSGFDSCQNLSGCLVSEFISGTANIVNFHGFLSCKNLSNCHAYAFHCTVGTTGIMNGFSSCTNLSSCITSGFDSTSSQFQKGFNLCTNLSSCRVTNFNAAFWIYGFESSNNISSCSADDLNTTSATGSAIRGFRACNYISSSSSTGNTGAGAVGGFISSNYISSVYTDAAVNNVITFVDTADATIPAASQYSTGLWWT